MAFNRETLSRIPVLGYLLRLAYVLINLPRVWTDIHRELVSLRHSLREMDSASARRTSGSAVSVVDVVRSEIVGYITDHSAQLAEHTSEIEGLSRSVDALQHAFRKSVDDLAGYSAQVTSAIGIADDLRAFRLKVEDIADWRVRADASLNDLTNLKAIIHAVQEELASIRTHDLLKSSSGLPQANPPVPPSPKEPDLPVYIGGNRMLVRAQREQLLLCKSDDIQITPSLIYKQIWEPALTRIFHLALKPGMNYLEAGAHIGYFAILAAGLVGHTGRVHAFEPTTENYELLEANTRLNRCKYICELHKAALADVSGDRVLHRYRNSLGSSTLSSLPPDLEAEFGERLSDETVQTVTLDEIYAGRDIRFDFLKIDAEGSEVMIFEGGHRFFNESIAEGGILAVEYNPPALLGLGANPAAMFEIAGRHRWRVWRLLPNSDLAAVSSVADMDDRETTTVLFSSRDMPEVLGLALAP